MPGVELSPERLSACVARFPVLGRLEAAFGKVFQEVKYTVVSDIFWISRSSSSFTVANDKKYCFFFSCIWWGNMSYYGAKWEK